ncbi:uncharacterized protein [Diadema antillarum]|uniref:uncharacterized protein n=1 Tax=Diadema antillarum TaxID=105358 RepID=UPI003A874C8D
MLAMESKSWYSVLVALVLCTFRPSQCTDGGSPSESVGQRFVFTFPQQYYSNSICRLFMASASGESVSVTINAPLDSHQLTLIVDGVDGGNYTLPQSLCAGGTAGKSHLSTIVVEADDNISLHAEGIHELLAASADAFLVLPENSVGYDYIIASSSPNEDFDKSQFSVTVLEDATSITIHFNHEFQHLSETPFVTYRPSQPLTLTLSQYESIQFQSSSDFTGTRVSANKPISVSSGNTCNVVSPQHPNANHDYFVEQLPPIDKLGSRYIIAPFANIPNGFVFRVIAPYNNTIIVINGTDSFTLEENTFYEEDIETSQPIRVEATKPVLVVQFMKSHLEGPLSFESGPSMTLVLAENQYSQGPVVFNAIEYDDAFATVVMPAGSASTLRVNGETVTSSSWEVFEMPSFDSVIISGQLRGAGRHVVESSVPSTNFAVYIYSPGLSVSYATLAAICFTCIEVPPRVSEHPLSQTVNMNSTVQLTCRFEHARRHDWYRNDVIIENTENLNTLIISSVTARDIGYYFCLGVGWNDQTVQTNTASVYVENVANIQVTGARFDITFTEDLRDPSSTGFRETANNISSFVETGLMSANNTYFETPPTVVCSRLTSGSVVADMNIFIEGDSDSSAVTLESQIQESMSSLADMSNGYLDASTIRVQNKAICPNTTWTSPRFGDVVFPVGEIDTWANSTGLCPFNSTRPHQPIAIARCVGDFISQSTWQPEDNCGPIRNVTELLMELSQTRITEESVGDVSEQVAEITTNIQSVTADDVILVSELFTRIADLNTTDPAVTEHATRIVSNLAGVSASTLLAAESETGAISDVVEAFQKQLREVPLSEGEILNIVQPNVAVQIQSIPSDTLGDGMQLSLSGSTEADLTMANFITESSSAENDDNGDAELIVGVGIPQEVINSLTESGSGSAALPDNIRVTLVVFSTPALFISTELQSINEQNEDFNRTVNSPVLALTIGEGRLSNLTVPIDFTFSTLIPGYANPLCSFWDVGLNDWSQEGCSLVSSSESSSGQGDEISGTETIMCECDHLTHFAVLMDTSGGTDPVYRVLSYIGCGISVLALLITLFTYLWNKELRKSQTQKILISLCATLLCLYVSFIVMVSLDTATGRAEITIGPCAVMAAIVHYFILSSITWMGVEGFNIYLGIVRVFQTYIPGFMLKAAFVAWGLPAVIVIITGAIAREYYATRDVCFLGYWARVGGLLIPMAVILTINTVIFLMVMWRLHTSAKAFAENKVSYRKQRQDAISRLQNAICVSVLLGLTWVTGYLLLIDGLRQVVEVIFIIVNSLQGLFIFLLYCLRVARVRRLWGLTCCDDGSIKDATTISKITSTSLVSQTHDTDLGGELYSGATMNPTYDIGPEEEAPL